MSDFIGEIKTIPHNEAKVFEVLSNMENLGKIKDKISYKETKITDFDKDSCSFDVNPVGSIKFRIIEREPNKTIKFQAEGTPIGVNMWIQLIGTTPEETKMKLTIRAEMNAFLKPMLSKPLEEGVEKISEILARIPYDQI